MKTILIVEGDESKLEQLRHALAGKGFSARLATEEARECLEAGDLSIDLTDRRAYLQGSSLLLTQSEFDLLVLLVKQPYRAFSRRDILTALWRPDFDGTERVVDVRIASLRQKLKDNPRVPRFIESVYGVGYRFIVAPVLRGG
jgi:DNA-binding response OmpR family regulator